MDYFSTTIKGVGKVVSVGRELIAVPNDNEFIKSLGIDVLKYVNDVYIVVDSEKYKMDGQSYSVAHICVKEDIGMETVYKIRDSLEAAEYEKQMNEKRSIVYELDKGSVYVIHI